MLERAVKRLAWAGIALAMGLIVAVLARGNSVAPGVCVALAGFAGGACFSLVIEIAKGKFKGPYHTGGWI